MLRAPIRLIGRMNKRSRDIVPIFRSNLARLLCDQKVSIDTIIGQLLHCHHDKLDPDLPSRRAALPRAIADHGLGLQNGELKPGDRLRPIVTLPIVWA
jgi:hypothetical protein